LLPLTSPLFPYTTLFRSVEVALTFVLLFWMARLNVAAVRSGTVRSQDIALREPNWPARNRQIQNAYHNQLEPPTLFYVLTILSIDRKSTRLNSSHGSISY